MERRQTYTSRSRSGVVGDILKKILGIALVVVGILVFAVVVWTSGGVLVLKGGYSGMYIASAVLWGVLAIAFVLIGRYLWRRSKGS